MAGGEIRIVHPGVRAGEADDGAYRVDGSFMPVFLYSIGCNLLRGVGFVQVEVCLADVVELESDDFSNNQRYKSLEDGLEVCIPCGALIMLMIGKG